MIAAFVAVAYGMQVPYAQVNQSGEEIALNGATLVTADSPYAEAWHLSGPTPVSYPLLSPPRLISPHPTS